MGLNCVRLSNPVSTQDKLDASLIRESKIPIIFLIGGSGAGKATQCEKIAKRYTYHTMLTKELLRAEISTGSQRGVALAHFMSEGELVPTEDMVELIKARMLRNLENTQGFVVSGFPRKKEQCWYFDTEVRRPDLVLYLYLRNSILLERVLSRTITATERQQLSSDEIMKRTERCIEMINPILRYYKEQSVTIDGEQEMEKVFDDICCAIDNMKKKKFPSTSVQSS